MKKPVKKLTKPKAPANPKIKKCQKYRAFLNPNRSMRAFALVEGLNLTLGDCSEVITLSLRQRGGAMAKLKRLKAAIAVLEANIPLVEHNNQQLIRHNKAMDKYQKAMAKYQKAKTGVAKGVPSAATF